MTALPPPDSPVFYAASPAGQFGPVTLVTIVEQYARGQLAANAAFSFQGAPGWMPLEQHETVRAMVQQLRAQLANVRAPSDDELDATFGGLIKQSWAYFKETEQATLVDEVLLGATITSTLDNGFMLIDLTSSGEHHFLRFEHPQNRSRILFRLQHLTPGLVASKVLGHNASVIVGYGEPVSDFGRIWQALKAELKSGYIDSAEPGTITVDADVTAGYIYVQVDMFWKVDDYVKPDLSVDYSKLTLHVGACTHALRKYLHGRIRG